MVFYHTKLGREARTELEFFLTGGVLKQPSKIMGVKLLRVRYNEKSLNLKVKF